MLNFIMTRDRREKHNIHLPFDVQLYGNLHFEFIAFINELTEIRMLRQP